MKKVLITSIIVVILIFINGCTTKQNKDNLLTNDNLGALDYVGSEQIGKKDKITLIDLKELLETSSSIEVKNTENQTLGQLVTGENIIKVIENMFSYNIVNSYKNFSEEDVIATINFYVDRNYPIYGLIKESFIYIEGYYFIAKENDIKNIIKYFEINTEIEPIDAN